MNINKAHLAIAFALVAAGATHPAHAVSLNPRGLGQVLVYPYYTVNKGQDTLLSLVNTSELGKVTKVSFLEGYNGRPVLDLAVYLSPHDVWTARISQRSDTGGAALFTNDHSCTVPTIPTGGQGFSNTDYAGGSGSAYPADGGPTGVTRTREGSVEIIAAADIVPGTPLDVTTTHLQNGTPNGGMPACAPSVLGSVGAADVSAPSSDLFGAGAIINVGEGTLFAYNADAINGFTDRAMITPAGGMRGVGLDGARSRASASPTGAIASVPLDNGQVLALDYARGIDAVSAVFMADAIHNEYLVDADLGAATDWVVTFPTKRFYTDSFYTHGPALAPFEEAFHAPGLSSAITFPNVFDREEGAALPPLCGVPAEGETCGYVNLPYDVNVISFQPAAQQTPTSVVLGSSLTVTVPPYGPSGSVRWDMLGHLHLLPGGGSTAVGAVNLTGLPVVGFMVYNVINANAQPGKLANYSGLFPHRANVSCSTVNPPAPPAQDPCT